MTDTTTTKTPETPKRIPAIAVEMLAAGTEAQPMPYGLQLKSANGNALSVDARDLTPQMQAYCMVHGLKQKLIDAAAISRDAKTGKTATVATKWSALMDVYERLIAGQWYAEREGGGTGSLLFAALCRMQPEKSPEAIQTWLAAKDDKQRKALEGNPKVAAIIAEIRTERAKATAGDVDSDALLAELDDATAEASDPEQTT